MSQAGDPVRARDVRWFRRAHFSWFAWALAGITAAGFAIRLVYVLVERRGKPPGGDAHFYHATANLLADGEWFVSPLLFELGRRAPAAEHPPLYSLFLAVPSLVGLDTALSHELWSCVLGTATIVVVGLLGRAVAGRAVGVGAAAIAAVYPNIWAPDGMIQAETAATFTATLAVLLAYRYWRDPSWTRLAWVGAACGAAALARSELVLLVAVLMVPLAVFRPALERRDRLVSLGAGATAALLVMAPWVIFNVARFEQPVLLSSQYATLLAAANCDSTYYGDVQGYFDLGCATEVARREGITDDLDQSQQADIFQDAALDYVGDHKSRVPAVVGVRLLRAAGLYHPTRIVNTDRLIEGRGPVVAWSALISFYAVAALAATGAVMLRRRHTVPVFPLLAPTVVVLVTVIVTYASTRFRAGAEPTFVVLAAVPLVAFARRLSTSWFGSRL